MHVQQRMRSFMQVFLVGKSTFGHGVEVDRPCHDKVAGVPQEQEATQLQSMGRPSVCQVWEVGQQLPITICPVEDVTHHLLPSCMETANCQPHKTSQIKHAHQHDNLLHTIEQFAGYVCQ